MVSTWQFVVWELWQRSCSLTGVLPGYCRCSVTSERRQAPFANILLDTHKLLLGARPGRLLAAPLLVCCSSAELHVQQALHSADWPAVLQMRQTTKISSDGVHFKSTDNARVDKTVKEAEAFGKKLQHMKKHLLSYHTTTEKLLVEVSLPCSQRAHAWQAGTRHSQAF